MNATEQTSLEDYAGKFSDGAPGNWETMYRSNAWHVKLPNGARVSVPSPILPTFWNIEFGNDAHSSVLWLRSLKYLEKFRRGGTLALNDIDTTVRSFNEWMAKYTDHPQELKSGSLDHQIALRLRTACTLHSLLLRETPDVRTKDRMLVTLERLVTTDVGIVSDLDLFEEHNHGIMLATAMLHASVFFPDAVDRRMSLEWLDRVRGALSRIVDADGLAPENTVSYQIFYVNLLEQLTAFLQWAELEGETTASLVELSRTAVAATRRLLLPDGSVPPLGDSSGGQQSRFSHTPGRLYSPSNGYFVDSDERTYFSMKAGFRSVIHKQMDDGSVILWRDGVYAIRDAGLLSYDQNDPEALAVRGQRGHSSTALTRFDGVNAMKMVGFSTNTSRVGGSLHAGTTDLGRIDVRAVTTYDGLEYIDRHVASTDRNIFVVTDTYVGSTAESVVTRFLLDENVQSVHREGLVLTATVGSVRIKYDLSGNGWLTDEAVTISEGIAAVAAYKPAPIKVIEIAWGEVASRRSVETVIVIG